MSGYGSVRGRFREWLHRSNVPRNLFACYFVPWMALTSRVQVGRNVFDHDWDLLIILDACRVDALEAVADEYAFVDGVDRCLSPGSSSKEWLVNTFREEYADAIGESVYLTGNGWVDDALTPDVDFSRWTVLEGSVARSSSTVHRLVHRPTCTQEDFQDVWIQPLRDVNGVDGFPAEELTDQAIRYGRETDPDRLIVHYMQPHEPYLHRAAEGKAPRPIDERPFELLREGHDPEPIWDAYLDNLRYVLDEVERLLENYDAPETVITADHGELFGEQSLYGHAEGIPHPKLRLVPWIETAAADTGTATPDPATETATTASVDERLSALGYR